MKKKTILKLVLLLCATDIASGQGRHAFNNYSVENGLASNSVKAIIQDRTGFIWIGTKSGLSRFDGTAFKTFPVPDVNAIVQLPDGDLLAGTSEGLWLWDRHTGHAEPYSSAGSAPDGIITSLKYDKDGILWALSPQDGLFRLDSSSATWSRSTPEVNSESFTDMLPDREGIVWLSCDSGNLIRSDARRCVYSTFDAHVSGAGIMSLLDEDEDNILLGLENRGIVRMNKRSGRYDNLTGPSEEILLVHSMIHAGDNELWIGAESGLYIFDKRTHSLRRYVSNLDDQASLPDNAVTCLCEDSEGGVWLGTSRGGAAYTSTEQNFIKMFIPSSGKDSFHGKTVRDIQEDADGSLWIGTEDSGVYHYDKTGGTFTDCAAKGGPLPFMHISALYYHSGILYIGLSQQGFCTFDTRSLKTTLYPREKYGTDKVLSIIKTSRGDIWTGTGNGLFIFDQTSKVPFAKVEDFHSKALVQDICEDRSGTLWFATSGDGLYAYEPGSGTWKKHDLGGPSEKLLSVNEDNHDYLWIGTEGGGAFRYDPLSSSVEWYGTSTGLPSDTVFEIVEDKLGNLWFSTSLGLTRLSSETGNCITYTHNYGAPSNLFNYKSALKASDGKLYFGTVRGFMELTPEEVRTSSAPPKVVFTGYTDTKGKNYLESEPPECPELKLRYDQTRLTISYTALSYTTPQNIRYSYKLRGLDSEWTETRNKEIMWSRIPPGRYTLQVRGANGDGPWSDTPACLRIRVTPPFLMSAWGISLEVLLLLGVLIFLYIRSRKKMDERNRQQIMQIQETERSVAQKTKIDFFASIIHEIRTPLSLIKAPFEQIKRPDISDKEKEESMATMEVNIDRLLQLSNEILDFSRIEEKAFTVRPKKTDVNNIVEDVIRGFSFHIRENRYEITKSLPEQPLIAWVDQEILIKIVSNLLGNAVKFAENKISIRLEDVDDKIRLTISNDGPLIAPEDREKVFLAFYRENRDDLTSGTGLGLPLVKRLSELHGGRVYMDGDDTTMNTIVAEIAKGKEPEEQPVATACENEERSGTTSDPGLKTIALVDDDSGIRNFLRRSMTRRYNVITCSRPTELREALDKDIVDMVITDIMMPETDGISLCRELKSSFEYSHIPIILLSAKTDKETKMEGLEAECDAFIEKPFSLEQLEGQIENIFARHDHMRDYYARYPHLKGGGGAMRNSDQDFLDKISSIITEHMDEDDFSIDKIADILSMSRSSLYRKIRGTIAMAPNELIQTVRLKKAAELLAQGVYRVSEVGYLVGFSNVAYFSTCFRKQFGVSPTEFKKNETH